MRRQWKRTFATLLLTLSVVSQASIALADTTPSPSASPSTDATATASPDASAQPSATSSPTPSVSDSPTPVASDTPSPAVSDSVQPTLTPTPTTPTSPSPSPTTSTPSDHLIIRLIAGLTSAEQQSVIARHGGTETSSIPALRLHFVDVAGGPTAMGTRCRMERLRRYASRLGPRSQRRRPTGSWSMLRSRFHPRHRRSANEVRGSTMSRFRRGERSRTVARPN